MLEKLATVSPEQWGIAALCIVAGFALSAWCILDAWKQQFEVSGEKVAWIQLIVFIPLLGALAYVFFGKKRGVKS